jgi:hypothetical protein
MSSSSSDEFQLSSWARVLLLQKPIYQEDKELWDTVLAAEEELRAWFLLIAQELVINRDEGLAFIRQIQPPDDSTRIPRLMRRSPLSYDATVLLVCLREEMIRFDSGTEDSRRLVKKREDLREMVAAFLRETTNQVRDLKGVDRAIDRLEQLGFLQRLESDLFEVMRILKARIGPAELETIRDRLITHANAAS